MVGNSHESLLLSVFDSIEEFTRIKTCAEGGMGPCSVFGVPQAPAPYLIAAMVKNSKSAIVITATESEAMAVHEQLRVLTNRATYLAPEEIQLNCAIAFSRELSQKRLMALRSLIEKNANIVVASVESAMAKVAPPDKLIQGVITLKVGEVVEFEKLTQHFVSAGYERVLKAEGKGQFRLEGGILDVFSPDAQDPVRVEFFDDEVDSIRIYDFLTQRSIEKIDSVKIMPAKQSVIDEDSKIAVQNKLKAALKKANDAQKQRINRILEGSEKIEPQQAVSLFYQEATIKDYLDDPIIFIIEPVNVQERAEILHEQHQQSFADHLQKGCLPWQFDQLSSPNDLWKMLETPKTVCFHAFTRSFSHIKPKSMFNMELRPSAQYGGNFKGLMSDLKTLKQRAAVVIYAGSRAGKLMQSMEDFEITAAFSSNLKRKPVKGEILVLGESLISGFESSQLNLCVFAEGDIYGSSRRPAKVIKKHNVNKIDIFADLKIGDYVVHQTHGVGVFKGFEEVSIDTMVRDYLVISYSGSDKLFVPIDQLDRVQKFIGAADKQPKISKLGSADWKNTVSRVKKAVKELAIDLVKLYSERKSKQGFKFSKDTLWQRQLEDAFEYDETPDQLQSIEQIKQDMESGIVMDRLLCGDVGYGKTEVAFRAAFKAVQDNKQAAILVPTTVLAQQHYQKILGRFEGFPINVELMSRFRTAKQQKETLKRLKDGLCDIVIGTHRLLNKDVVYKDLGLLIIDEEQRFGVGHKEFIKDLKSHVDVLTLSATPIPRTLHMALTGIRDMSVIETPPDDRYPVQTYVMEYSPSIVREALLKEINRGGQAYILCNRVKEMEKFIARLSALVPEVRFAMAHGQMAEGALEKVMIGFLQKEYDVLVCSTIIESGLDIANANTIIITDADKLGLSQLYQLRGRVGRTNRLAYAYLMFMPDKVVSEIAAKRLSAIKEFTEFGSGFKIAMRDLEIRGAGNLLGAQQHGHMDDVGYDMYCKLVEDAVKEVSGENVELDVDTVLDIPLQAHIAHNYIKGEEQRMEIYKKISSINSPEGLDDVWEEIEDRFGTVPQGVVNLMNISLLRAHCKRAHIIQLSILKDVIRIKFHPEANIDIPNLVTLASNTPGCAFLKGGQELKVITKCTHVEQCVTQALNFVQKIFVCNL